jgi:tetratricopeptide (TPR) repeat protein
MGSAALPAYYRGDLEAAAAEYVHRDEAVVPATADAVHAMIQFERGLEADAARALARWELAYDDAPQTGILSVLTVQSSGMVGDVLRALGTGEQVRRHYDVVKTWGDFEFLGAKSRGWVLGQLALRLELVGEAEGHFRAGLEYCERERCVVEAGRCHQGLAEVEERHGNLEAAREHLDRAGELFAQHGAKLYLDQVIAKKEILKA